MKEIIDNMSVEDMLRMVRFSPPGSRYFVGKTGEYFEKIMAKKREEIGPLAWTQLSKEVGWVR